MAFQRLIDIPGQERAVKVLARILRRDQVAHAYVFVGPSGVEKEPLALALAQVLLCRHVQWKDSRPLACAHCTDCGKVERGTHPDLHVLRAQGAMIRVDQVRDLQKAMAFAPLQSERRVCILPDAHRMNAEAANALLKTLEEPPPKTYLLLTAASPGLLLPTIVSRCQMIRCGVLAPDVLAGLVKGDLSSPQGHVSIAIHLAEGSLHQARDLLEGELLSWRQQVFEGLRQMDRRRPAVLFRLAAEMAKDRDRLIRAIQILRTWSRDLLILALHRGCAEARPSMAQEGGSVSGVIKSNLLINKDLSASLREWTDHYRVEDLTAFAGWLERAERLVDRNVNRELIAEATLIFLLRQRLG